MSKAAKCEWTQDNYWECSGDFDTSCGHRFSVVEGTPTENEFKFCCFCGKRLVEVLRPEDPVDEE